MGRSSAARAAAGPAEQTKKVIRCAIYTRKSTDEGLQQEFNSLDAQRESAEAYITSQKQEGWQVVAEPFDDGGYSGGNMDRPALKRLLAAVEARTVDCVVVYKVDRLSRSLMDFARIIEIFDRNGVSFVSVTQQFNTTNSLGRLTLNILLSFAQFEREIISERTRDKMSAARRKGKWIGGHPVLGYDIDPKGGRLIVNEVEATQVRTLFSLYLELGSLLPVLQEAQRRGIVTKAWTTADSKPRGGHRIGKSALHGILTNAIYTGVVDHKGRLYPGEHERIIDQATWDEVQRACGATRSTATPGCETSTGHCCAACCSACPAHPDDAHIHGAEYSGTATTSLQRTAAGLEELRDEVRARAGDRVRGVGQHPAVGPGSELARAVATEAVSQILPARANETEAADLRRKGRQLNLRLVREAGDPGASDTERAARMAETRREIETVEGRLAELAAARTDGEAEQIEAGDLHGTLAEFDGVWASLTTREQEQMIRLLIAKVGYDGQNGKVTVNFSSKGAKELCQGKG